MSTTKSEDNFKARQDTMSWVGQKKTRLESKKFELSLLGNNSAKRQEELEIFEAWARICIIPDHGIATSKTENSEYKKEAFERLQTLRVAYGDEYTESTVRRQEKRKKAYHGEVVSAPRIAKSKWVEFLKLRPVKNSQREVKGEALVSLKGQREEFKLGPAKDWFTTSAPKALGDKVTEDKLEMMKADIKAYGGVVPTKPEVEAKQEEKAKPEATKGEVRKSEMKKEIVA